MNYSQMSLSTSLLHRSHPIFHKSPTKVLVVYFSSGLNMSTTSLSSLFITSFYRIALSMRCSVVFGRFRTGKGPVLQNRSGLSTVDCRSILEATGPSSIFCPGASTALTVSSERLATACTPHHAFDCPRLWAQRRVSLSLF